MQHKNKFSLPAMILALGIASQAVAHADLFGMKEVSGHGQQIAAAETTNSKCGKGSCGAAKASEKKEDKAAHKCGKKDQKCGTAKKSCHHKCGKKGTHKCAASKKEETKTTETAPKKP
jgi:hypothetical protein